MLLPILVAALQAVPAEPPATSGVQSGQWSSAMICSHDPENASPVVARIVGGAGGSEVRDTVASGFCPERWIPDLDAALLLEPGERRLMRSRWNGSGWDPPALIPEAAELRYVRLGSGRVGFGGGRLVFSAVGSAGDRRLWQLHSRVGRVTQLTRDSGEDDGAVVSPDGLAVWFHSDRAGTVDIWRWRIGNSGDARVTRDAAREVFPTPGEDRVWYLAQRDGEVRLMVDSFDELPAQVVDPSAALSPPALSPDGTRLCWVTVDEGDAEIAVRDLTTGVDFHPVPSPGTEGRCRWDPVDPATLWFESDRTGDLDVFRWNASDNSVVNVTRSPGRDRLMDLRPGG